MDIREALAAEHSKRQTEAIVDYIGGHPDRFAELMAIFFASEYRLTQRAAWPMSVCAEEHPELIEPYISKLVGMLPEKGLHNAVKRNIVRLLQYVEIPKRLEGKVYAHCLDLISDPSEKIAVHAFSVTVAERIARRSPALMRELRLVVNEAFREASPGVCVRIRRLMQAS